MTNLLFPTLYQIPQIPPPVYFTVESADVPKPFEGNIEKNLQNPQGGISKKFTSDATESPIFGSVLYRWDFGDGTPFIETTANPYVHEYISAGTYDVKHQTCYINTGCCSEFCIKQIPVSLPPTPPTPPTVGESIALMAGFFGLIFITTGCKQYKDRETCEKSNCEWIAKGKESKCTEKRYRRKAKL